MDIVLGSQSERRKELLQGILRGESYRCVPPDIDEDGFTDCGSDSQIEIRLLEIVEAKLDAVQEKLAAESPQAQTPACVVCADTIVVVGETGSREVLGKPPEPDWQPSVRNWFRDFYSGREHEVWTGFVVAGRQRVSRVIKTRVIFPNISDEMLEWYVSTQESRGKAGGYGIQGHAAAFVQTIDGSLTNVIGLPVLEVGDAIRQCTE